MYTTKLTCIDCKELFVYSDQLQKRIERNHWRKPKRCFLCSKKKKNLESSPFKAAYDRVNGIR